LVIGNSSVVGKPPIGDRKCGSSLWWRSEKCATAKTLLAKSGETVGNPLTMPEESRFENSLNR